MRDKIISVKMNNFIHGIHENTLVIYKKGNNYYSVDRDVYLYKGLFGYRYGNKNNRMIIFITEDYLNYIISNLKRNMINFVIISINRGYDNIYSYNSIDNNYYRYYMLGKRMIRNEKRIKKLIDILRFKNDIELVKRVNNLVNGCY